MTTLAFAASAKIERSAELPALVRIAIRAPPTNTFTERWVGRLRRELRDHAGRTVLSARSRTATPPSGPETSHGLVPCGDASAERRATVGAPDHDARQVRRESPPQHEAEGVLRHPCLEGRQPSRFQDAVDSYGIAVSPDDVPYGAIVGFARLTDVITKRPVRGRAAKWFIGDYGLLLEDVVRLKDPVPATGALGFWRVRPRALRACLDQLAAADRARLLRGPILAEPGTAAWIVKGRVDRNGRDFLRAGVRARWVTRRAPKGWSAGDTLFFWRAGAHPCLIGLGRLLRVADRDRRGDTFFRVEYSTNELASPVPIETLREDRVLASASFLKRGPAGTVFPLTDAQSARLAAIAIGFNGDTLSKRDRGLYTAVAKPRER